MSCTEEDGCVVNYGGGREYWCPYADQDTVKSTNGTVTVYCTKLRKKVVVCEE